MTGSDQSRDSGHSRESGDTSEAETVYDCIKSDLQVDDEEDDDVLNARTSVNFY